MIEHREGWYAEERDEWGPFRWMSRKASLLVRGGAGPGLKFLRFAAGHTFPSARLPLLKVFSNSRLAWQKKIGASFASYVLSFESAAEVKLDFYLDRVFHIPQDSRDLGIIIRDLELLSPQQQETIFGEGWQERERDRSQSFRWMSRKASILLSPSSLKENKYLWLHAYSQFRDYSQRLSVNLEGKKLCEIPLLYNWNDYSLSLPEEKKGGPPQDDFKEIILSVNKVIPGSQKKGDTRELGIQVRHISLHDEDRFHQGSLFFHANAVLNFKEMLRGKARLKSYPLNLGIDIYGRCNISPPCVYCEWEGMKKVEGEAAQDMVDDRTLDGYGPFFRAARTLINCSIGEPLIHPRLEQILELCENNDKILEMATNGQALTPRVRRALLGKRIDLYVSLDAATKETYAKIRNNRWDSIIPNLILLNQDRKEQRNLPRIFMVFMPMRVNQNELEGYFQLCQKVEADYLVLRPLNFLFNEDFEVERGGYIFNYRKEHLSQEELREILQKCREYSLQYGIPVANQFDFGIQEGRP